MELRTLVALSPIVMTGSDRSDIQLNAYKLVALELLGKTYVSDAGNGRHPLGPKATATRDLHQLS